MCKLTTFYSYLLPACPSSSLCRPTRQLGQSPLCWRRGVPLFFGCSQPQARALVTRHGLMFVLRHLRHHGHVLDFLFLDSGVVGLALLAPGCIVTDTQSLHGLEAWSSAVLTYVLLIASSCSTDSGLTQPPAAAYAYCMTHAVPPLCI
jgi:hypothetical protein